jgi:hypothetical protein
MNKRSLAALYQAAGWFLVAFVLIAGCHKLAQAAPYPRLASYHGGSSGGAPFVKADGTLDDALIKLTARYPIVTLNPNACLLRPDMPARFRYHNPKIKLLLYHQLTNWHLDSTFVLNPSDTTFYAEQQRTLNWAHAWVPGAPAYAGFPIDWKQQDGADSLIKLWVKVTRRVKPDGWFFDYFNPVSAGAYGISDDDDHNRLYHTRRLVDALHAEGVTVYGNGPGTLGQDRCGLDGGMNEGFPNGLTPFATAIKQNPGYWLKSESAVGTSGNATVARYTLGVACLTGAFSEHGNSHYTGAPEAGTWWFPEYSVTPNGQADPTGSFTSWLGEAIGPPSHISSAIWRRHFVKGCVVVNTGGTTQTVQLGGQFRQIGSQSDITQISVPPVTSVFLWRP